MSNFDYLKAIDTTISSEGDKLTKKISENVSTEIDETDLEKLNEHIISEYLKIEDVTHNKYTNVFKSPDLAFLVNESQKFERIQKLFKRDSAETVTFNYLLKFALLSLMKAETNPEFNEQIKQIKKQAVRPKLREDE